VSVIIVTNVCIVVIPLLKIINFQGSFIPEMPDSNGFLQRLSKCSIELPNPEVCPSLPKNKLATDDDSPKGMPLA
jgi:hypothetical protein